MQHFEGFDVSLCQVIAGENDMSVTVKESGVRFAFNFKDVYWNSRLSTEHQRLVDLILGSHNYESSTVQFRSHKVLLIIFSTTM